MNHDRRHPRSLLLLTALLGSGSLHAVEDSPSAPFSCQEGNTPAGYQERLLDARVNGGGTKPAALVLQGRNGALLATRQTLESWGLNPPQDQGICHRGQTFLALDLLGLPYSIDGARQTVVIEGTCKECFPGTVIALREQKLVSPQAGAAGAFLNYDALYESTEQNETTSGTFEIGFFNGWGVGTTTFLTERVNAEERSVRLNTTWRRDRPEAMRSLLLGDTVSRTGSWGRAVQFGGIQWGSNFATQPDFITFPLARIEGEAAAPSSLELYANNLRLAQRQIEPGPFTLNEIPVVTGANEIQLVVQDVLGREQVVSHSFYTDHALLRKGLHDYTYEAGAIRENYTLTSDDYGRAFVAGTHRLGLSDRLTGELRAEILADQQTAGVSGVFLTTPWLGVLNASFVASRSEGKEGNLAGLGIDRHGRRWSYGLQASWASEGFRQLGTAVDEIPPERTVFARLGTRLWNSSSLAANYLELDERDGSDSRFVGASFSTRFFLDLSMHLLVSHDLEREETFAGVSLTTALGSRSSASLSHMTDAIGSGTQFQWQRNLPRGPGFGYRVLAEERDKGTGRAQAQVMANADFGVYSAEVARFGDENAYRLTASGGATLLGDGLFFSRRVHDSFGVVQVGDYPDVRVYHENQEIGRTNAKGSLFIPDMRAFERNNIRVEQSDLPLDVSFDRLSAVAIPGFRQGALVNFQVETANGVLLTLWQDNGEFVPLGAQVILHGSAERFLVARRGEVWVTGMKDVHRLEARWEGHHCVFEAALPRHAGPLPKVGPVICREVYAQ
ncbi:MAG: fimbria/pilus outer membrane usher protein [Thiohalomonadaceae bacterium]